jgi:hypothetical protein
MEKAKLAVLGSNQVEIHSPRAAVPGRVFSWTETRFLFTVTSRRTSSASDSGAALTTEAAQLLDIDLRNDAHRHSPDAMTSPDAARAPGCLQYRSPKHPSFIPRRRFDTANGLGGGDGLELREGVAVFRAIAHFLEAMMSSRLATYYRRRRRRRGLRAGSWQRSRSLPVSTRQL